MGVVSSAVAIRQKRDDLQAIYVERVHAQHVRHTCGVCGETRSGRFGETIVWFKAHAKTCRRPS